MVMLCACCCRLFCAKIESHYIFEIVVICLILLSCASLAIEGPSCQREQMDAGTSQLKSLSSAGVNSLQNLNASGFLDVKASAAPEAADECTANKYRLYFDLISYSVYGIFFLEMLLCSVSRGFIMTACTTCRPYLRNNICRVDFVILLIMSFCMMDTTGSKGLHFIKVISPAAGLVRHKHIQNITKSFASSLPMLFVVSVPIMFLMAMLAIVGVDLFGDGQMKRCVLEKDILSYLGDEEFLGYNITECHTAALRNGGNIVAGNGNFPVGGKLTWANPPLHFDNALYGIETLLAAATAGVMPTQQVVIEIQGPGQPPLQDAFKSANYFFVAFHLIFTFFLMNLFIGVMSISFSTSTGSLLVTGLQRRWVQFDQGILGKFSPHNSEHEDFRPDPGAKFHDSRLIAYTIVTNLWFERATTFAILCNCGVLLSDGYPRERDTMELVEAVDMGFVSICESPSPPTAAAGSASILVDAHTAFSTPDTVLNIPQMQ